MITDQQLIQQTKAGDHQAFKELVIRYEQVVRATLYGMLGNSPDTDDVAQEVFIRFHKSIHQFRGDASLKTYLTRIAINLAINQSQKNQRKNKWIVSLTGNKPSFLKTDTQFSPERMETKDMIQNALKSLDPDFRSVVVLRLIDGYSVEETANILNIPEGTVASRLARAQKKLRKTLSKLLEI